VKINGFRKISWQFGAGATQSERTLHGLDKARKKLGIRLEDFMRGASQGHC
jgi:hypothetical protein